MRDVDVDDDYDNVFLVEDEKKFGTENLGSIANPSLKPYVYKGRFLDTIRYT